MVAARTVADQPLTRRTLAKCLAATTLGLGASGLAVASGRTRALAEEAPANRVCATLGIDKPVIQPLMLGLTSPELVAAVSNAGGMGTLELPDAETIRATKALTDKPFAVGYYGYDDETAAMLKEEGVNVVLFANGGASADNGFTNDLATVTQFKDAGFTVIFKSLNTTHDNVLAAQDAGADLIAVLGFGAGGCGPTVYANTAEHLAEIASVAQVPLLAGGGIVNATTAAFAAAAGAEGAYVGTRFLASVEAPCSDVTKQAIVDARAEDIVLVPWTLGYMPMTRSALTEQGLSMQASGATADEIFAVTSSVYAGMATGEIAESGICVGCGVGMIEAVATCQEIVDDIAAGFGF